MKIVSEKTSYHNGGLEIKPPSAGQFLNFSEKITVSTPFGHFACIMSILKKNELLGFGRIFEKNLFCSVQSAPPRLLVHFKIRLKTGRSRIWLKSFT